MKIIPIVLMLGMALSFGYGINSAILNNAGNTLLAVMGIAVFVLGTYLYDFMSEPKKWNPPRLLKSSEGQISVDS